MNQFACSLTTGSTGSCSTTSTGTVCVQAIQMSRWNRTRHGLCNQPSRSRLVPPFLLLLWLPVLLLALIIPMSVVDGMITIIETHATFANTVDNEYGPSLQTGYEYYSRLQYVINNPSLCRPHDDQVNPSNSTIVIPTDQLPVSILVVNDPDSSSGSGSTGSSGNGSNSSSSSSSSNGSSDCTLSDKIQYALTHIVPLGRVKYLIVATEEEEHINNNLNRHRKKEEKHDEKHDDIPLSIIHVSVATHNELYNMLVHEQSQETINNGGMQISIDNNRHSHEYYPNHHHGRTTNQNNETLLYTALIVFLVAGVCFFMILLSNDWDDDAERNVTNGTTHTTQPTRQRLTREQVRSLYPIYRYDGESKLIRIVLKQEQPQAEVDASPDPLRQPLLSSSVEESHRQQIQQQYEHEVIHNMTLDVCSICLDEYERNDKIRILPCQHTFHSKCVGRWLSERSAVCPLCKDNLFIEPDEVVEEEAVEENNNTSTIQQQPSDSIETSSWVNVWRRFVEQSLLPPTAVTATTTSTAATSRNATVVLTEITPTITATTTSTTNSSDIETSMSPTLVEESNSSTTTSTAISSSWWSRMFPSSTVLRQQQIPLTEPLLPQQERYENDDDTGVATDVESAIEPTSHSRPASLSAGNNDTANDNGSVIVQEEAEGLPAAAAASSSSSSSSSQPTISSSTNLPVHTLPEPETVADSRITAITTSTNDSMNTKKSTTIDETTIITDAASMNEQVTESLSLMTSPSQPRTIV